MHRPVNYCHFKEGWVQHHCCKIAWIWWWWSWSFPAAWFTICIIICYFTLVGCVGLTIRGIIITRKYFTLGLGRATIVTGLLILGFSSHLVWSFLRYVSITVRHIFAGTGTCPCFREYFSLGGCISLERYNIFGYCTTVIIERFYFTLGGCLDVRMSNAICGGVVTPLSFKLVQWYCWEGLFSMMAFSRAHHWQISSEVLV